MMFICFPCEIDKFCLFLASSYLLLVTLNFRDVVDTYLIQTFQIPVITTLLYRIFNCRADCI